MKDKHGYVVISAVCRKGNSKSLKCQGDVTPSNVSSNLQSNEEERIAKQVTEYILQATTYFKTLQKEVKAILHEAFFRN